MELIGNALTLRDLVTYNEGSLVSNPKGRALIPSGLPAPRWLIWLNTLPGGLPIQPLPN